jgi:hypothetical protein
MGLYGLCRFWHGPWTKEEIRMEEPGVHATDRRKEKKKKKRGLGGQSLYSRHWED